MFVAISLNFTYLIATYNFENYIVMKRIQPIKNFVVLNCHYTQKNSSNIPITARMTVTCNDNAYSTMMYAHLSRFVP